MTSGHRHLRKIRDWLASKEKILISGHQRPDGDCLGSSLALGLALTSLGKKPSLLSSDPVPERYRFLPGSAGIKILGTLEEDGDGVIILECSDFARTGISGLERLPSLNIDHHGSTQPWADLNWIDPSTSAVGELVFLLIKFLEVEISPEIAINLFTAIMTDTGSFQYSNTSEQTLRIASELVRAGASPSLISREVYMNQSEARLKLLARVLATLQIDSSERIATINMSLADLESTEANDDDTEGFVNYPLSLSGIEASVFFRECGDKNFKVSLRSKETVDVSIIASSFGGGGHARAAGCSLNDISLAEAQVMILERIKKLLQ